MKKRWKINVFLFIVAFLWLPSFIYAESQSKNTEELLIQYPVKTYNFDYGGYKEKDICTVSCKKVRDYSTDPTLIGKQIWYQFHILIKDSRGKVLLDDLFSSIEKDFMEMFERFGIEKYDPPDYVKNFFNTKKHYGSEGVVNEYRMRIIDKKEIDKDWLSKVIIKDKIDITANSVVKELTTGQHMVVQYMGHWAEDLRQCVYSKKLGESVWLLSPYDME
jgi:hypothetical protein